VVQQAMAGIPRLVAEVQRRCIPVLTLQRHFLDHAGGAMAGLHLNWGSTLKGGEMYGVH